MGKEIHSSGCEILDKAKQMQKEGVPFEDIGRFSEGNCSGDCDKCKFNLAKKEKPKIYFLQHGNPEVKVIEYDDVETEYHFQNMMAMALMIGHEDGTFTDKAFGYWNDTWYHALPSEKEDQEDFIKKVKERVSICRKCKGRGEYKNIQYSVGYKECPDCDGYGLIIDFKDEETTTIKLMKCQVCGGTDFAEYDGDTVLCQDCGNCQIVEDKERI